MSIDHDNLVQIIPELRLFARTKAVNQSDADDLVQRTLTRSLEKQHLFKGGKLIAWTITMMKNIIIDDARQMHNKSFVNINENDLYDGTVHTDFVINDVNTALQRLSDKCREVLVLIGGGHTYKEISEILLIETGTVMSRLSRCRKLLVQAME